jgi:hypothetical protein
MLEERKWRIFLVLHEAGHLRLCSFSKRHARCETLFRELHRFYAEQMLPNLPPDLELVSLSQTFGDNRIVEEFVIRFTHTLQMDWMLPGVPATNRKVEFGFVGVIGFQGGKVASELSVGTSGPAGGSGRAWEHGATSETRSHEGVTF